MLSDTNIVIFHGGNQALALIGWHKKKLKKITLSTHKYLTSQYDIPSNQIKFLLQMQIKGQCIITACCVNEAFQDSKQICWSLILCT